MKKNNKTKEEQKTKNKNKQTKKSKQTQAHEQEIKQKLSIYKYYTRKSCLL